MNLMKQVKLPDLVDSSYHILWIRRHTDAHRDWSLDTTRGGLGFLHYRSIMIESELLPSRIFKKKQKINEPDRATTRPLLNIGNFKDNRL